MRRRLTYANIVSTLCLVIVLSGSAYAAAKITGKDIKNNSVTGKDLKANSVPGADIKDGTLGLPDLRAGTLALPGAQMDKHLGEVAAGETPALNMDAEGYDTGNMYTAPQDIITVRRTGIYQITGMMHWGGAGGATRQVRVLVDGDIILMTTEINTGAFFTEVTTGTLRLSAGQTLSLGAYNSGSATVLTDVADAPDASLTVQMISP